MIPRGADALIKLRLSGKRPENDIFILVGEGREPDWWKYSNTIEQPELLILPTDPLERLDLRCVHGLRVIMVCLVWDDREARVLDMLTEHANEVAVMSPAFDTDIGWRWIRGYGRVEFGDSHWLADYQNAVADSTHLALGKDKAAYLASQANEARILEAAPWLSSSRTT